ncbi:hypothetical protein GCM10012275_57370 [Longimycelium tulufanense]|uniref:Uncharacterized protein n=1 Tax=Longimycelium tulufanense TaxID=907463 RepID=A0A8J3CJN7_9PSEU|nr:hypothetical protein [Longimycelium tulufanense]GGM79325.1 hypothetical protein GCM10012275_57370 [Longimycelium tulufanense]
MSNREKRLTRQSDVELLSGWSYTGVEHAAVRNEIYDGFPAIAEELARIAPTTTATMLDIPAGPLLP